MNRLEHFVIDFEKKGENMTGEELHAHLDEIEKLHGLYSPVALGFAAHWHAVLLHFYLAADLLKCF